MSPLTIRRTSVILSTRHLCPSVAKFEFSRQTCIEEPNIKLHGNPSNGSRTDIYGRTDGHDKATVQCIDFGRLNFQTVGWGRLITQRQRRDWSSPPLCLCKYSCPCHTEVPSK